MAENVSAGNARDSKVGASFPLPVPTPATEPRKLADCYYCGRPTYRRAANGKPCCSACDDLPGKEAL